MLKSADLPALDGFYFDFLVVSFLEAACQSAWFRRQRSKFKAATMLLHGSRVSCGEVMTVLLKMCRTNVICEKCKTNH